MTEKRCTTCKKVKPLTDFSKGKAFKDGYQYKCRLCVKLYHKAHYPKIRDKMLAYGKKWRDAHPGYHAEKSRQWREKYYSFCKFYSRGTICLELSPTIYYHTTQVMD